MGVKYSLFRHIHFITSCFKSVNNQTWIILVAAISDPRQAWLAAVLDFETFIEDSAVSSDLLSFIAI